MSLFTGDELGGLPVFVPIGTKFCEDCGHDISWRLRAKTGTEVCYGASQPRFCVPCLAERKRSQQLASYHRLKADPDWAEHRRATAQAWRDRNREHYRKVKRLAKRRQRARARGL